MQFVTLGSVGSFVQCKKSFQLWGYNKDIYNTPNWNGLRSRRFRLGFVTRDTETSDVAASLVSASRATKPNETASYAGYNWNVVCY